MLERINAIIWGPWTLIFLFGTHVFLTFRLGIIQKYLGLAIKLSVSRDKEGEGDVSHFGSLMTALAATIGTGNIVGVSTAIAAGGPGAVLWMWLSGVFGMATKYSEALLSVKFREKTADGTMMGGPMLVLEKGMNMKWLGILFAVFTAVSAFGIGNMVQSNSVSSLMYETFQIPTWISGVLMTLLTGFVILGGIKSIARACEALVPFMAVTYMAGCILLLILKADSLPETMTLIIQSAFTGQAAVGGFLGAGMKEAMRFGVARGLFSNESGMGSAAIVAAAAQTKEPVRQALVSSTGTFWDTVVMCAVMGVVVVNSGEWTQGLNGAALTKEVFSEFPGIGPALLTFGLLTFVISTILGWSYYGERAIEYLAGKRAIKPYRVLWVIAVFIGSISSLPVVWALADITNALMALPNLISLLVLSGLVAKETKEYFSRPENIRNA